MVALQHVEAVGEAVFRSLEHRKVMQVLDLVMGVELLQEKLQPRRKPGAEVLGAGRAGVKRGRSFSQCRADLAKHGMALQPELRHGAEVGMAAPPRARITVDQQAQIRRPARAAVEQKIGGGSFHELGHTPVDKGCAERSKDCMGNRAFACSFTSARPKHDRPILHWRLPCRTKRTATRVITPRKCKKRCWRSKTICVPTSRKSTSRSSRRCSRPLRKSSAA